VPVMVTEWAPMISPFSYLARINITFHPEYQNIGLGFCVSISWMTLLSSLSPVWLLHGRSYTRLIPAALCMITFHHMFPPVIQDYILQSIIERERKLPVARISHLSGYLR
jgi:hypothetical protein